MRVAKCSEAVCVATYDMPSILGPLPLTAVVAAGLHNGIGVSGTLPWRLPKDMAYFRTITSYVIDTQHDDERMRDAGIAKRSPSPPLKNAVIMGRTTWESIPPRFRPLQDRINVIVSTTMQPSDVGLAMPDPDTMVARSFEEAVTLLQARRYARYDMDTAAPAAGAALGRAFVIGGATLYQYALAPPTPSTEWILDHMLMTRIYGPADIDKECDVFLPEFRSPAQVAWEASWAPTYAERAAAELVCPPALSEADAWQHVPPAEHAAWLPAAHASVLGAIVPDRDSFVHMQLWRRVAS